MALGRLKPELQTNPSRSAPLTASRLRGREYGEKILERRIPCVHRGDHGERFRTTSAKILRRLRRISPNSFSRRRRRVRRKFVFPYSSSASSWERMHLA